MIVLIRLESSRMECHLLEQGRNRARIVGYPQYINISEFCARLGIRDDPTTQALFSIFQNVCIFNILLYYKVLSIENNIFVN